MSKRRRRALIRFVLPAMALCVVLSGAVGCEEEPLEATLAQKKDGSPPEGVAIHVLLDNVLAEVDGAITLREKDGDPVGQSTITFGVGEMYGSYEEGIAEVRLDGYCDGLVRVRSVSGIVRVPIDMLVRGTTLSTEAPSTESDCRGAFLHTQEDLGHEMRQHYWASRAPVGRRLTWCVSGVRELRVAASWCGPSVSDSPSMVVDLGALDSRSSIINVPALPISSGPVAMRAKFELPDGASAPLVDIEIVLQTSEGLEPSTVVRLPAPLDKEVRIRGKLPAVLDIEVFWGALRGAADGYVAGEHVTIPLDWDVTFGADVRAPSDQLLKATWFRLKSSETGEYDVTVLGKCEFDGLAPGEYALSMGGPMIGRRDDVTIRIPPDPDGHRIYLDDVLRPFEGFRMIEIRAGSWEARSPVSIYARIAENPGLAEAAWNSELPARVWVWPFSGPVEFRIVDSDGKERVATWAIGDAPVIML